MNDPTPVGMRVSKKVVEMVFASGPIEQRVARDATTIYQLGKPVAITLPSGAAWVLWRGEWCPCSSWGLAAVVESTLRAQRHKAIVRQWSRKR